VGISNDAYDLPHARGINAAGSTAPATFQRPLTIGTTTAYPSEAWGGHERVVSQYGILSYQRSAGALTMQLSATLRASALAITPDVVGDVLFTGLAQAVSKHNLSTGLQAEGLYELSPAHRLRGGITFNWSRDRSRIDYAVLPVDGTGQQTSTTLLVIPGLEAETRRQLGAYLEDEWLLGESLTINTGLRFDSTTNSGGGHALSPAPMRCGSPPAARRPIWAMPAISSPPPKTPAPPWPVCWPAPPAHGRPEPRRQPRPKGTTISIWAWSRSWRI
jgi:outer membrane receptor protein involved in Fe transport